MFSESQLNAAQYVAFYDVDSKQPLNVGTFEAPTAGLGPYIMTPAPPFGGLGPGNTVAGLKYGVRLGVKQVTVQYSPKAWPFVTATNGLEVLHQYGNGTL